MGRLLVVLDLNGTILQRLKSAASLASIQKQVSSIKLEAMIHGRPVISRPNAHLFLTNLLSVVDVAVWTSAQPKNAVPMVMLGFGGLLDKSWWEGNTDDLKVPFQNFQQREDFP